MSKAGGTGCPDANLLAAYVDHRLGGRQAAEFEAHLASCLACAELLAEALSVGAIVSPQTGRAEPDEQTGAWRRRLVAGGAVAAALVAALILPELAGPRRDDKLADLAAVAGARWPVEGRLTGGIPHSSLNAPLAGGQGGAVGDPVRVQLVAGKIREDLEARGRPEQLHSFGLSQLLLGRLDAAAAALTAAAREQPLNASYQSDAAAVYLERARAGGRPDDLPRALAAAERARLASPAMLEGLFNRALALDRLSLSTRALHAWNQYLRHDATSSWAGEARRHLIALSRQNGAAQWPQLETRLRRNVDAAAAEEAVRSQMTAARNFLESQLWPAWATAVDRGDDSREREALRTMAAAFASSGDDLYADAVEAIDRSARRGAESLRRLAKAHREYAAAAALFADDRFGDAAAGLSAARSGFVTAGSAFATRTDLDVAVVAYYAGRANESADVLAALERIARTERYAFVSGRVSWVQGLIAFGRGQYGDSRAAWETTLAVFEELGDADQQVGAHGLLAGLHDALGNDGDAWVHREAAMRGLDQVESNRLRHGILVGAAGATWKKHGAEGALVLQGEVVTNAMESRRPSAIAEAFTQRAAMLFDLGRTAEATTDIASGRAQLGLIAEPLLRDRRESALLELEAKLQLVADATRAASTVARAIALAQSANDRNRLPALHLLHARAVMSTGRSAEAEGAIADGMAAFAALRTSVAIAGGSSRDSEAWGLFDVGMQLALRRKDLDRAFDLAAVARNRDSESFDRAAILPQVRSRLAANEAVIALNQLNDELVVWLVTPSGVEVVHRPIERKAALRLAARHRDEIEFEVRRPTASAGLFNELIRPIGDRLRSIEHLIVVPDGPYYNVSFAALWDRDHDRFVIDDRSVSVLSDVGALATARTTASGPPSAFVDVAVPSTADAAFALWSEAPDRALVRVAAPVRANNLNPRLSSVSFADAPGRRYSGLVLTRDIASRDLSKLSVVVLSDCKPGSDLDEGPGTLGVAAAFLSAGVESVVAPLWPIDEVPRAELLARLDRDLGRNTSTAAALRSLQRDVLRSNGRRLGAWTKLVAYGVGR